MPNELGRETFAEARKRESTPKRSSSAKKGSTKSKGSKSSSAKAEGDKGASFVE